MSSAYRVGIGHDTHRFCSDLEVGFEKTTGIKLGGILIPYDRKLHGHSDADVVLHALSDAILGAMALGDIGDYFPDTNENWQGCDSAELLTQIIEMMKKRGGTIINIDIIIFAEKPKLGTQKETMKNRIAQMVGLSVDQVNIKAKTGEQIGIIGRSEAISAQAIILITL